jgi:hypothetical protein
MQLRVRAKKSTYKRKERAEWSVRKQEEQKEMNSLKRCKIREKRTIFIIN